MPLIKRRRTLNGFISQEGCASLHANALPLPFSPSFSSPLLLVHPWERRLMCCGWRSPGPQVFRSLLKEKGSGGQLDGFRGWRGLHSWHRCLFHQPELFIYSYYECWKLPKPSSLVYKHSNAEDTDTITDKNGEVVVTHIIYTCVSAERQGQSTDVLVSRHAHTDTRAHTPARMPICSLWGITLFLLKWISIFKSSSEACTSPSPVWLISDSGDSNAIRSEKVKLLLCDRSGSVKLKKIWGHIK